MKKERPARTMSAGTWTALGVAIVFFVALIIFIAQNGQHVTVKFFSAEGSFSLAVALLAAALGGALTALLAGAVRALQLRRSGRRRPGASGPSMPPAPAQPSASSPAHEPQAVQPEGDSGPARP